MIFCVFFKKMCEVFATIRGREYREYREYHEYREYSRKNEEGEEAAKDFRENNSTKIVKIDHFVDFLRFFFKKCAKYSRLFAAANIAANYSRYSRIICGIRDYSRYSRYSRIAANIIITIRVIRIRGEYQNHYSRHLYYAPLTVTSQSERKPTAHVQSEQGAAPHVAPHAADQQDASSLQTTQGMWSAQLS